MVLVAGEAEVDEPLAVEGAGHRLQNLDAPLAILDQIVVGRQDARDALLGGEGGEVKVLTFDPQVILSCFDNSKNAQKTLGLQDNVCILRN